MAAYGVVPRIEPMILLPVISINIATLSLTGVNYGAMLFASVRETFSKVVMFAVVFTAVGAVLLVFFGEFLMRIFTDDAAVIGIGVDCLRIGALLLPAYAVTFIASAVLPGLKKPIYTLHSKVVGQIIGQLVMFYLAIEVFNPGINSIWLSVLAINWVMAMAYWWLYTIRIRQIETYSNHQSNDAVIDDTP